MQAAGDVAEAKRLGRASAAAAAAQAAKDSAMAADEAARRHHAELEAKSKIWAQVGNKSFAVRPSHACIRCARTSLHGDNEHETIHESIRNDEVTTTKLLRCGKK